MPYCMPSFIMMARGCYGQKMRNCRTRPVPCLAGSIVGTYCAFVSVISANFLLFLPSIVVSAWSPSTFSYRRGRGCRQRPFPFVSSASDKHQPRILFSTFDADIDDDEEEEEDVETPQKLRQALWEMSNFPTPSTPSPDVAYSVPDLTVLQDSQSIRPNVTTNSSYPEYPGRISYDEDKDEQLEHGPTADDCWFLNEDDYVQSRERLNPDGSLSLDLDDMDGVVADEEYQMLVENLLKMQSPNVPSSFLSSDNKYDSNDSEPTLESLLQQKLHDPTTVSEELHAKVFEQEEGFLNQSEVFRKSLTAEDSNAAMEAARLRRGADYRKRQDDAISKLTKEMDDFEAQLNNEKIDKLTVEERCFKCGCALSPQELQQFRSKRNAPASRRLCSVCYSDLLVANSDKSFFRDNVVPSAFRSRRGGTSTNYGRRRPSGRQQPVMSKERPPSTKRRDVGISPPPPRQTVSPPPLRRRPVDSKPMEQSTSTTQAGGEEGDIESLKREVKALHDELQHIKEENELDPDDIGVGDAEWEESLDDDAMGAWTQVIDPDTGDVFWWNEETEEMKWEL